MSEQLNSPPRPCPCSCHSYLLDTGNGVIRKWTSATNQLSVYAGSPGQTGVVDGAAGTARFGGAGRACTILADGTMYIAEASTCVIRKVRASRA
jgi:hypothetical protein